MTEGDPDLVHPDAVADVPEPTTGDDPVAEVASRTLGTMSPGQRTAFSIINVSTAPVWLAMILFPNSRVTSMLVRVATPLFAALGITYTGLLVTAMITGDERINFADPDSVRRGLQDPNGFLAGWTHYLAFDLFVGRWIWQESMAAGKRARLPLLLTWLAGPMGLTLFLARRTRW